MLIHGGPVSQYSYSFSFEAHLFAANDYVVVRSNPRGSSGYGQDFCFALYQGDGEKDYRDVLAAVDRAIELGYSDPDRLGVGGYSYGGILTNYIITQTDRFKGAVSGAGSGLSLANYGHDMYQRWWEAEFGLPWETRELWDRLSPFNYIQNVSTPTMFACGEKDWNVPAKIPSNFIRHSAAAALPPAWSSIRANTTGGGPPCIRRISSTAGWLGTTST